MLLRIKHYLKHLAYKPKDRFTYGILPPCFRCNYGKSYENVLITTDKRGPRIVVEPKKAVYVRHGKCLGTDKCNKCLEVYNDLNKFAELPCEWHKL